MTRRRAIRTGGIGAALGFIVLVFVLPRLFGNSHPGRRRPPPRQQFKRRSLELPPTAPAPRTNTHTSSDRSRMVISKRQALLRKPWRELTTRTTELGVEKLCPGCLQWWPQDEEFFSFISTRCHFHNECRACRAAAQARRRQSRIAA